MSKPIKLTPFKAKALQVLLEHPNIRASAFAELLWPESYMHRKVSNQGNGATHGKAAWLCAGSYLGKLRKQFLVRWNHETNGYSLTAKGELTLKAHLYELSTAKETSP